MTFIQKQALWVSRDADGNIVLHFPTSHVAYIEGATASVNGVVPDENKNVTIDVGVKKVNDVAPDEDGNVVIEDYVTGASISGKTITLNFKDGTSQTLTTQDTVPTDYVSNLAIRGKTITVTFKDGTTKTLTTQDTAPYTASATAIGGASATKPAVVVSSYRSGTSWWRKYSDGWVEQGGLVSGSGYNSVTISLHVVMKTTEYCAMSVAVGGGKVSSGFGDASNLTTSTFSSHQHGSHRWYVCGY